LLILVISSKNLLFCVFLWLFVAIMNLMQ